jgi:membrane-bound lytic murein transglycosylase D
MRWKRTLQAVVIATTSVLIAGCNFGSLFQRFDRTSALPNPEQAITQAKPVTAQSAKPQYEKRLPRLADRAPGKHDFAQDVDNLWQRIGMGLKLAIPGQPEIEREVEWYRDNQEFIDRTVERARPYLHYIVEEIDRRKMPLELALLPVVESAYRPTAYSRHKAAGVWQFIPATGRRFGLKQNNWYDGRRDVLASTQAALDYLQQLHDEMDGDWLNAIAAYNCGERNVLRAIEQNRRAGKPTDFWSLKLPKETKGYVPRLLAVSTIVKSPTRFNVILNKIPNRPFLATVDADRQVDLGKVAAHAGVSLDELRALNPGYLRRMTDPKGPHLIALPIDKAESFKRVLADNAAALDVDAITHKVRKGESIASVAKRYGVAVDDIRSANNLGNRRLQPGQELVVPGGTSQAAAGIADASDVVTGEGEKIVHTVQAGDSLWTIARNYQVSVRKLAMWNGIDPGAVLNLEQQIVIWMEPAAGEAPKMVRTSAVVPGTAEIKRVTYEIQNGDSLWTIARRFQVSVDQLCLWNGVPRHTVLQPGSNLQVYVGLTGDSLPGLQI